jgi:putative ABC transport system permease protein
LTIIGFLEVPSRYVYWVDEMGFPHLEVLHYVFDEIQLPLSTWELIWQMSGGEIYIPTQLAVIAESILYLEDSLSELRNTYPDYSMFTVIDQVERAQTSLRLETPPNRAPLSAILLRETTVRGSFQEDLRVPITVALFATAALVIAANLLIMVSERKMEIAILKTVGSKRSQIMVMILAEAFVVASLGGILGFMFVRIQAMLTQLSGAITAWELMMGIFGDLIVALGASGIVALIFGIIPAMKMATLSVMEVMRGN